MIFDAQVHVWGRDSAERPWPIEGAGRARAHTDRGRFRGRHAEFGPDELVGLMDAAGVDAAVLVPPNFEGDRNDLVLSAAAASPERFAVMGRVPLEDRAAALDMMQDWRTRPGARGFRVSFTRGTPAEAWLTDGTKDWFWAEAAELGLPLMVNVHGQFDALARVAERHPDLRIALDHFGLHSSDMDEAALAGVGRLLFLARLPNISVKASGAPCYTTQQFPFATMQRCIQLLVEAFGATRVFWGSDLTRLPSTYDEAVRLVTEGCPFLAPHERDLILGQSLASWLDWQRG